jgi:hypothetical protein
MIVLTDERCGHVASGTVHTVPDCPKGQVSQYRQFKAVELPPAGD